MDKTSHAPKGKGCGPLAIFVILAVIIALIFGISEGFEAYTVKCDEGENIWDCLQRSDTEASLTEEQQKSLVTATGPYTYKDFTVTVTMKIPLSGGPVTGSVSGACTGRLSGTYGGQNNGGIGGTLKGSCTPFVVPIPARAEFQGSVSKDLRNVSIDFTGKGAGFTHRDSMTLTY